MRSLILAAMLPLSSTAIASQKIVEVNGCEFPASVTVGEQRLPLRGTHNFTWWGFDVYTVAFYAPESADGMEVLDHESPRQLILHYHRDITKENFVKATEKSLKKNRDLDKTTISSQLNQLYNAYQDMPKDGRYVVTYDGSSTTTLALNDEETASIEGAEFAEAFFGIWVSDKGISDRMAEDLRGE